MCTGEPGTAIEVAREMLVDLVLADVSLATLEAVPRMERRRSDWAPAEPVAPVVEGYALLRALEVDPSTARFPVVYLRASDDRADAPRFGIVDYVQKPLAPHTLLQRVEGVLQRFERRGAETKKASMEGAIDVVGAMNLLQLWHSSRVSGIGTFRSDRGRVLEVLFADGEISAAWSADGDQGPDVIFQLLSWANGRFQFVATSSGSGPQATLNFEQLLLEGCRRLDEVHRRDPD